MMKIVMIVSRARLQEYIQLSQRVPKFMSRFEERELPNIMLNIFVASLIGNFVILL